MTPAELLDWLDRTDAPSEVVAAAQDLIDRARERSGHPLFPDLISPEMEKRRLLEDAIARIESLERIIERVLKLEADDLDQTSVRIIRDDLAQQGRRIKRRLRKLLRAWGELPPLHP
jgi:hypothetical protein